MKEADSPDNWIQIRLFYNAINAGEIRKLDRRVLETGSNFEEKNLVESWHIRYDGPSISLRVRPKPEFRIEVEDKLETLKEELTDEGLIKDWKIDMKTFLQSNEIPKDLESWEEWNILMEILHSLSLVLKMVHKLEKYDRRWYMFHTKAVHHLYNMAHIQDTFFPFVMKKPYDSIVDSLKEGEAKNLAIIVKDLDAEKQQWLMKLHYGRII